MHTLTIPKLFVYNFTQVLSLRHRMLCVLLHFKLNVKFVLIPLRSVNVQTEKRNISLQLAKPRK